MSDTWWYLLVTQVMNGFVAGYVGKQFFGQPDWNTPAIFKNSIARTLFVVGPQVVFVGVVIAGFIFTEAPWILLGASVVIFIVALPTRGDRTASKMDSFEGEAAFDGTARAVHEFSKESCKGLPRTPSGSQSLLKFIKRGALILTWMFLILMFLFDFRSFFVVAFSVSIFVWAALFYVNIFASDT